MMPESTRIVVLGDSVTAGCGYSGVTETTSFVRLLDARLKSNGLRVQLIRSALDGTDTGYAVRRFDRMVTSHHPEHVLVMLGVNDVQPPGSRPKIPPSQFRENLCQLVERTFAIDARPVLASPNPRFNVQARSSRIRDLMRPYAAAVLEVADRYLIGCVNVHGQFPARSGLRTLIPDGLHPGPLGQALIANAMAATLIPLLQTRDAVRWRADNSKSSIQPCESAATTDGRN